MIAQQFRVTDGNAKVLMPKIGQIIRQNLEGGAVSVAVQRDTRTIDQNALVHVLISDIANSVNLDGQQFSRDAWKALLVDQFEQEQIAQGTPLQYPSKVVPSLDKGRAVTIRPSTALFDKHTCATFIEFLFFWGAEHGAVFSERSMDANEGVR